ncbi:ester cyclase [Geodermatophilus sp. URMC 64]
MAGEATGADGVVRALIAAQDAHDVPAILRLMTEDVVYEDTTLGVRRQGHEGVGAMLRSVAEVLSTDYRITAGQVVVTADGYAVEWVMEGTNDRDDPGNGLPATGQRFAQPGVPIGRLRDGKIAENRDYWNLAAFLTQVGLMPGAGPAG